MVLIAQLVVLVARAVVVRLETIKSTVALMVEYLCCHHWATLEIMVVVAGANNNPIPQVVVVVVLVVVVLARGLT
jgi:16S rRNA A1518/A1519 N6-dimethyltransferase RsmA/KsgA/DIM1 with predicted DNA glycosylase/AP lyase activity